MAVDAHIQWYCKETEKWFPAYLRSYNTQRNQYAVVSTETPPAFKTVHRCPDKLVQMQKDYTAFLLELEPPVGNLDNDCEYEYEGEGGVYAGIDLAAAASEPVAAIAAKTITAPAWRLGMLAAAVHLEDITSGNEENLVLFSDVIPFVCDAFANAAAQNCAELFQHDSCNYNDLQIIATQATTSMVVQQNMRLYCAYRNAKDGTIRPHSANLMLMCKFNCTSEQVEAELNITNRTLMNSELWFAGYTVCMNINAFLTPEGTVSAHADSNLANHGLFSAAFTTASQVFARLNNLRTFNSQPLLPLKASVLAMLAAQNPMAMLTEEPTSLSAYLKDHCNFEVSDLWLHTLPDDMDERLAVLWQHAAFKDSKHTYAARFTLQRLMAMAEE